MRYIIKYSIFENKKSNWSNLKDLMRLSYSDIKKKGLIGSFKDTILYNKDDHNKFILAMDVYKFINNHDMTEITEIVYSKRNLEKMVEELKKENSKEYSEKKYQIAETIISESNKLEKRRKKELDKMIMEYYHLTSRELLEDLDEGIDYFENSGYINQKRYKDFAGSALELLIVVKNLLSLSSISSDINNILKNNEIFSNI